MKHAKISLLRSVLLKPPQRYAFATCRCYGNVLIRNSIINFQHWNKYKLCSTYAQARDDIDPHELVESIKTLQGVDATFESSSIADCIHDPSGLSEELILRLIRAINTLSRNNSEGSRTTKLLNSLATDLDEECIRRAASWNMPAFMKFFEQYHASGIDGNSRFLTYALRKRYLSALGSPLPLLFSYLRIIKETNSWRRHPIRKYELEYTLKENFDNLTWEEVNLFLEPMSVLQGVLVDDKLKKKLCNRLLEERDFIEPSILKNLLHLFCNQAKSPRNPLFLTPSLLRVLQLVNERSNSLDFECLTLSATLCSRMFIYQPDILEKTGCQLLDQLKTADLSLIEAAVEALTFFGDRSNSKVVYSELTKTMRAEPLLSRLRIEPKRLSNILYHLSKIAVYPFDLLDLNFSPELLKRAYRKLNKYNVSEELYVLASSVQLECPQYKGNSLNSKLVEIKSRSRLSHLPRRLKEHPFVDVNPQTESSVIAPRDLSPYNRVLYSIRAILDCMFGGVEYSHVCYLLPHFCRANILFSLDAEKRPQKLPPSVRKQFIVERKSLGKVDCYAIVLQSKNVYMDYSPFFMGEEGPKVRQLTKLGYKVIGLPQHGWLKTDLEEKKTMLKRAIFADSENVLEVFEKFE